ncbi:MAG: type II toxin-antitoxin system PemK/MazF family toxin, partial [Beijerinckiaceae bacterium]
TIGSQQRGRRPCVVLSADAINAIRRTVVVVPLSSSPKVAPPIVVSILSQGNNSVAVCDQIRAVDRSRFGKTLGALNEAELTLVEESLREVLVLA